MPWGKLDDSLYDNPKLDRLGKHRMACIGLWAVSISWCNRWLTDGLVPVERIRALGGTVRQSEALVIAGMFDRDPSGGYRVHDFLEFNDSREEVMARRAAATSRQRKVRGVSQRESHSESQRDTTRESQPSTGVSHSTPPRAYPVPSRPDLSPVPSVSQMTDDPADAYWSLTGKYPNEKVIKWVDELASKFGGGAVTKALAEAHIADPSTGTLLGRAQDRLRAEARALDRAEQDAERERLREKRAIPKVLPQWELDFRAAIEAQYARGKGAA